MSAAPRSTSEVDAALNFHVVGRLVRGVVIAVGQEDAVEAAERAPFAELLDELRVELAAGQAGRRGGRASKTARCRPREEVTVEQEGEGLREPGAELEEAGADVRARSDDVHQAEPLVGRGIEVLEVRLVLGVPGSLPDAMLPPMPRRTFLLKAKPSSASACVGHGAHGERLVDGRVGRRGRRLAELQTGFDAVVDDAELLLGACAERHQRGAVALIGEGRAGGSVGARKVLGGSDREAEKVKVEVQSLFDVAAHPE